MEMKSKGSKSEAEINTLIYYQKPCIGNEQTSRSVTPIQLLFPNGFGLGIPVKESTVNPLSAQETDRNFGVLASGPERTNADRLPLRGLQATFLVLAAFNIVITSLLMFDADNVDTGKVMSKTAPLTRIFDAVSSERRNVENVNYAFSIVIILIGSISVLFENCLGVSAYCLATLLNFLLGTSALPYFVYSFRYIFDLTMLYIALVLRSRLMFTFLPLQTRRM